MEEEEPGTCYREHHHDEERIPRFPWPAAAPFRAVAVVVVVASSVALSLEPAECQGAAAQSMHGEIYRQLVTFSAQMLNRTATFITEKHTSVQR